MINDIIIRAKKGTASVVLGKIDVGWSYSTYINNSGRAWGWGNNAYGGNLGDNTTTSRRTPVSVAGAVKTFCKISAGGHTLALDKNGRAWAWGNNAAGALGDNSITNRCTPVSVAGAVKTFCHISAGGADARGTPDDYVISTYSLALDKNGRAWGWGLNNYGQLGDNSITNRCTPVSVAGAVKTFCHISAGYDWTVGIRFD